MDGVPPFPATALKTPVRQNLATRRFYTAFHNYVSKYGIAV